MQTKTRRDLEPALLQPNIRHTHTPPWGEGRGAHNFLPIYMQVLPLSFLGLLNGVRGKKSSSQSGLGTTLVIKYL